MTGKAGPLISSFKLSYYTLLNLMRRLEGGGQDMEHVIRCSFQQFQYESSLPQVRTVAFFRELYAHGCPAFCLSDSPEQIALHRHVICRSRRSSPRWRRNLRA